MDMTLSDLRRLTLAATDGNLGSLVNLCFDDRSWAIRYLVVDASSWFPSLLLSDCLIWRDQRPETPADLSRPVGGCRRDRAGTREDL